MGPIPRAVRGAVALAAVTLVTAFYNLGLVPRTAQGPGVNPTTVALSYLLVILIIASRWGIAESTAASVLALVCFNFYFLPPVGTFTIADPQNWVAFAAFLVTAAVTSQLSGRARRRAMEAIDRRRDLERLYAVSRSLLLVEHQGVLGTAIAHHIAEAFSLPTVGVYDHGADLVFWGRAEVAGLEGVLRDVARRATRETAGGLTVMPIQLGSSTIGSLALDATRLSDTVLHAVANLAAIGIERARSYEATARAEAAQRSGELRAVMLDALAHEFKTPLTSMSAAVAELRADHSLSESPRELMAIVADGIDRLNELVSDAVHMLRVDAGQFVLRREPLPVNDVVRAMLRKFEKRLDGRRVTTRIADGLTVSGDRELVMLALRQLLDNAVKYSPPASAIEILGSANGSIDIAVRNSGPAIPERELVRVTERFYRGAGARRTPGTGMGLSIVEQIAKAHQGNLMVISSADRGTTFTLSLPRATGER